MAARRYSLPFVPTRTIDPALARAVRAGLAVGTLSRLEAGTSDPSWSSVRALAEALGVSLPVLGRLVEGDRR